MILIATYLLLLLLNFNVSASICSVSGDNVTTYADSLISIPVKINDNAGIMGFKISVDYPNDVLTSPTVTRGAVTVDGMFDNNISKDTKGKFDVIWNHVTDVKENGVIFVLQFKVLPEAKNGNYTIKLTYSQPDTFNEAWEDVALSMSDIVFTVNNKQQTTVEIQTQVTTDISQKQPDKKENSEAYVEEILDKVDSGYIQNTIENALENVGSQNIESMNEEQLKNFETYIDDALFDYGVEIESKPEDKDAYEEIYGTVLKDNFIDSVESFLDEEKVVSIIDEVLNSCGAENIEQLDESQKDVFIESVIGKLEENAVVINEDSLNEIDTLQLIKDLYVETETTLNEKTSDRSNVIIYLISVICAVAILVVIVMKHKITRRKNDEKII